MEQTATFADLEQSEVVTLADLKTVLQEFATSGADIAWRVVTTLVDRIDLEKTDLEELKAIATEGVKVLVLQRSDPHEYELLIRHLIRKIG